MGLTLHVSKGNRNGFKTLIVAEYLGIDIKVPEKFEMGVDNKTPEFLKLNPQGKVPVLETPHGPLFESNTIARYVASLKASPLLGSTPYETALVNQWIDFSSFEIQNKIRRWQLPRLGFLTFNAESEKEAIAGLKKALGFLNDYLASHTYLVGNGITLADIIIFSELTAGFKFLFSKEFTSEYPHFERYFWTLANQPQVKKVTGEIIQGENDLNKVPVGSFLKSRGGNAPAAGSAPPAEKVKAAKVKQAPKAKEPAKQKEAPKEVAADEEEEKPKPKPKNALDLLPPSPFVIDNWKRLYSNTKAKDFKEVAIKGFWEMYDPEGWSFWFCDYKYNEENDKTYVTMNKVGGFLQRLDFVRKYAFGKMLILGGTPPYKIKGVWLFRGQEIPQMVIDECYDVELYAWTKADLSSEEQKARINDYFEEPDVVDGEKLLEAKCFK